MGQTRPISPEGAYRTSSLIAFALVLGATLYAIVALFLQRGAGHLSFDTMTTVWLAFSVATVAAARLLWARLVVPALPRMGWRTEPISVRDAGRIQSGLIVIWGLLEGAALFGLVVYSVSGSYITLAGALAVLFIGLLATRPRRAFFGLR
jgi:F0F1-type ATP synthase membrane subunit c/vacuolar-type H+-ATPase subunit K